MKYTIEDLRQGKCAVINDGTLGELKEVLKLAFPEDCDVSGYDDMKYFLLSNHLGEWVGTRNIPDLPTQSVKDFLKPSLDDKIKELKELAKSQGMECDVVLSDSWEGVEFFSFNGFHIKIMNSEKYKLIYNPKGDSFWKNECKPSTEQAYIEQLKKEAFERFGDILDELDFFKSKIDRSKLSGINIYEHQNIGFRYFKHPSDSLYFNGLLIYEKGKWATKVKERIEVEPTFQGLMKGIDLIGGEEKMKKFLPYLAKQIENYLNQETECQNQ